ncbi:unnamed protein product [Mytilus edulis]|uniref:Uncharacterized protein n=1 Tax=Mytilus edulis TaxID=6550 RepID=A0A8S3QBG4_MYTED|nr:unnamed protein product [Mytilus edulis]
MTPPPSPRIYPSAVSEKACPMGDTILAFDSGIRISGYRVLLTTPQIAMVQSPNEKSYVPLKVVCATLNNQAFINTIIPMIAEKIMDQVKPKIIEIVDDRIHFQPYIDTITQNKDALILQEVELKKQSDDIKSLKSKLVTVESRIEEQEQYSRRTSLRFHNVPVPTDDNGAVITPIDTDDLVLRICNKKLKVKLNIFDIGRSHPIGEMKDGKISIIPEKDKIQTRHIKLGGEVLEGDSQDEDYLDIPFAPSFIFLY